MKMRGWKSSELRNTSPLHFHVADDRPAVTHPNLFPYRAIGHVVVELGDERKFVAPGTLLSDFTVLTSGYLVKNRDNEFLAISKLRFIPARNHSPQPFGVFDWTHIRALRTDVEDWALISLAEPAGRAVGCFGAFGRGAIDSWRGNQGLAAFTTSLAERDAVSIEEDLEVSAVEDHQKLIVRLTRDGRTPGDPLVRNWMSNNPQVIGHLAGKQHRLEDPRFLAGWQAGRQDNWLNWLCSEFGKRNVMDRFRGSQIAYDSSGGTTLQTQALQPDYSPFSFISDDAGPSVRYQISRQKLAAVQRAR
jgi:hypothetical protein